MNNPFDEMRAAVSAAKALQKACDNVAGDMAGLLRGRLRHVAGYILKDLKRELRDFNIHTQRWK